MTSIGIWIMMTSKASEIITEAQQILNHPPAPFKGGNLRDTGNGFRRIDKQVNAIVAIAKYKFKWRRKTLFDYILKTFPEMEVRLSPREKKYSMTSALYQIMDGRQKSTIIKRLDQIQKHNREIKQHDQRRTCTG